MNVIQAVIFDLCKPSGDLASFPGSPLSPKKKGEPGNEASVHASPDPFSPERLILDLRLLLALSCELKK